MVRRSYGIARHPGRPIPCTVGNATARQNQQKYVQRQMTSEKVCRLWRSKAIRILQMLPNLYEGHCAFTNKYDD
jgi:hypothetical protein